MDRSDEGLKLLKNIKHINILIEKLQEDIDNIYTALTNTTIRAKEVDVQTSLPADPMADKIAQAVEYQTLIENYQHELIELKTVALDIIKQMEIKDQQYLILKYFNRKTIDEIGEIVGYAYRQTWENIHSAEQQFIEIYNKSA
jgi:hypothetical protein